VAEEEAKATEVEVANSEAGEGSEVEVVKVHLGMVLVVKIQALEMLQQIIENSCLFSSLNSSLIFLILFLNCKEQKSKNATKS
jgi:hypothetical protein